MDRDRFDDLTRRVATEGASRRGAIRLLAAGALAALLPRGGAADASGRRCVRLGKACDRDDRCCDGDCRRGECRCPSGTRPCGGRCCPSDKPCRDGVCGCVPDRKATTCRDARCGPTRNNCGEIVECGGCGVGLTCAGGECQPPEQGSCPTGANSCGGGGTITCNGRDDCACLQTTEGETRCGQYIENVFCGACASSADCAKFGPGAYCAKSGFAFCCGPDAQNVCMRPCPA